MRPVLLRGDVSGSVLHMTVKLQDALRERNKFQIELNNVLPAYRQLRLAVHEMFNTARIRNTSVTDEAAAVAAEARVRDLLYETPNV